jgi:protein-S-isoprenylcysteine O-methyltransferase Ste14
MMIMDRYLIVRAASLYVAAVLTSAVWLWRRPAKRQMAGAFLAFAWNISAVLLLQVTATRVGWWSFDVHGGTLLGIPVDLFVEWAWLWGAIPALAFPSMRLSIVILFCLTFDAVLMPLGTPVIQVGQNWMIGEAIGLGIGLVPAQLLARWTARNEHLKERVVLQICAFTGLMLFVLPTVVITQSGSSWRFPLTIPMWQLSLYIQILMVPAVIGLSAVQEFATSGHGTPVPFDPPTRLVTTGIYAFLANPMQLAAVVLLLGIGFMIDNLWVAAAGVMAHLYSAGLAGWDEDEDLRTRFGDDWIAYRRSVPRWFPRLRPWREPNHPPALLFVAASCGMCSEVGRWFERRGAVGLCVMAAETHPSGLLRRITYEPCNGSHSASGIEAIARSLEHIHLGWAFVGFVLRLPGIREFAQLLADASGAEPRAIEQR